MKWGVPFEGWCLNVAATTVFTAGIMGNPLYFGVGVAVHFVMRAKASQDPHFFHLWRLWFDTKARSITKHLWGGSRLQPTPSFACRTEEVAICV